MSLNDYEKMRDRHHNGMCGGDCQECYREQEREAAYEWAREEQQRDRAVEAEARLAELEASADIWEKRCMDSERRLAAAEAERDEWREAAHHEDLLCEARLAAAERVVEAARSIAPSAAAFLYDSPYHSRYNALLDALDAYQKAYSSIPAGEPVALAHLATLAGLGRCVPGKGGCDSWRGHVEGCTSDLNKGEQS